VFDCDQGCFINSEGHHVLCEEAGFEASGHVALKPEIATSEPRDV
jgi:hypothetical protein